MQAEEIQRIKSKTIVGVAALIVRSYVLQAIALVGNFTLTVVLLAKDFGIYYVVTAIIAILNYFSDIGLAAALIQKNEEPTSEDYTTTFTIQQILVLTAVAVFFLLSPQIGNFFNLKSDGIWLMRALVLSFFLSSLKTIPSVILERKLEFGLKVIPQIIETFVFYVVAIVLALKGFGLYSFAWAAILRGLVGLIAIYVIYPWKITIGISRISARKLLSFGIPLQGGSLLGLVKDDLMTIYLGKILSSRPEEIGFIGWAKKWAEQPLRSFMDNIIAVSFPVYSRLHHDEKIFSRGIEKTLFFISFLIFPSIVGLTLIMNPLMHFIPYYYAKWNMGLISFYLFSISALLASLSSPLVQVLNAMGKAKTTFSLMLMWTILTWLLIPVLVHRIGFNGVALSAVIIAATAFLPAVIIKRYVAFSFVKPIGKSSISTVVMGLSMYTILHITAGSLFGVIFSVVAGIGIYFSLMYLTAKNEFLPYVAHFAPFLLTIKRKMIQ